MGQKNKDVEEAAKMKKDEDMWFKNFEIEMNELFFTLSVHLSRRVMLRVHIHFLG